MSLSQTDARRNLGFRLNELTLKTTGAEAVPDSGAFTGVASGPYAARRIVSSALANLGVSGQDTRRDWYDDNYALICLPTPVQRRVSTVSYTGADTVTNALTGSAALGTLPVGYVLVDRDLAAPIPAGTVVEFHSKVPPIIGEDNLPSLRSILNDAASAVNTTRTIPLTFIAGQYKYDLSAYGITRQVQLQSVLGKETTPGLEADDLIGGGLLEWDGNIPYLKIQTQLSAGDIFSIKLNVPAKSWVKTGASWAYSAAGYVNETDEIDVDPEIFNLVAYWYAASALGRPNLDGANAEWKREAAETAILAYPHMAWGTREVNSAVSTGPSTVTRVPRYRSGRRWA